MKKLNVVVNDVQKKGLVFNGNKRLVSYPKVDLKSIPRYKGTGCLDADGSFVVPCVEVDSYVYRLAHDNYTDDELTLEKQALNSSKENKDKELKDGVQAILDYMAEVKLEDEKLTSLVKALLPKPKEVAKAERMIQGMSDAELKALMDLLAAKAN